jgi:hypothetical protein
VQHDTLCYVYYRSFTVLLVWEALTGWLMMVETAPQITVLMCVHNGAKYLAASVESILAQSFEDFELLVIDNGSDDHPDQILESYGDSRIRVHRNPENLGIARSRNQGLQLARAPYIALQDADDLSDPTRLERQVAVLDTQPHIGLVSSFFRYVDAKNRPITIQGRELGSPLQNPEVLRWQMLFGCAVPHGASMFRRALALEAGGYGNLPFAEDFDMLARLNGLCAFTVVPEVLLRYRFHDQNLTQRFSLAEKQHYHLTIVQQQIERFLARPVHPHHIAQLRLYPMVTTSLIPEEQVAFYDIPPCTCHPLTEVIALQQLLLETMLKRFLLSENEQAEIQLDCAFQIGRLRLKQQQLWTCMSHAD